MVAVKTEYVCHQDDAPSEDLSRYRSRHRIDCIWGVNESRKKVRSVITDKVSDDVGDDDAGSREFNVQTSLDAQQQNHGHRKDSKEEFILNSSKAA